MLDNSARLGDSLFRGGGWIIALIIGGVAADLSLKAWASASMSEGPRPFLPFLSFHLARNDGVSFSLFAAETDAAFAALIAAQITIVLGICWLLLRSKSPLERWAFAFVIGGAVGNLIVRAATGAVTNFLRLHPFSYDLFTFNFADVLISCGVGMLVLDTFFPRRRDAPHVHARERSPCDREER